MIMSNKLNVRETEENKRHVHVNGSKKICRRCHQCSHTLYYVEREKRTHIAAL